MLFVYMRHGLEVDNQTNRGLVGLKIAWQNFSVRLALVRLKGCQEFHVTQALSIRTSIRKTKIILETPPPQTLYHSTPWLPKIRRQVSPD